MCCIVGEGEFASICMKKRHSSLVLYQVLVTVYAELYMAPGTHLSQPSAFWEKRWDGLVRGYENCTINYSCLGVPRLFLQAPENAGTALVLHASGFVPFLLAFCVVCAYFCLAIVFVSFSLALCVVHAIKNALYVALVTIIGNLRLA